MNWLWYHYLAGFLAFACAGGAAVVAWLIARDALRQLITRKRQERRFQNVIFHATRDFR
jgi:hypothetical protein